MRYDMEQMLSLVSSQLLLTETQAEKEKPKSVRESISTNQDDFKL